MSFLCSHTRTQKTFALSKRNDCKDDQRYLNIFALQRSGTFLPLIKDYLKTAEEKDQHTCQLYQGCTIMSVSPHPGCSDAAVQQDFMHMVTVYRTPDCLGQEGRELAMFTVSLGEVCLRNHQKDP